MGVVVMRALRNVGAALVLLVAGLCLPGLLQAQAGEPPFEWDHRYSSPGTFLSIDLQQTISGPPDGAVMVLIRSSGFDLDSTATLWWKRGAEYQRLRPAISEDGTVQILPGIESMFLGGYIRGQSFDIALVDEDTNRRAHAKLTPFPVTAQGAGRCTASAEIETGLGQAWTIWLTGFDAGEEVTITSTARRDTLTDTLTASQNGEIAFPILYGRRSGREAQVTALGSAGCTVTLEFAIGRSALNAE